MITMILIVSITMITIILIISITMITINLIINITSSLWFWLSALHHHNDAYYQHYNDHNNSYDQTVNCEDFAMPFSQMLSLNDHFQTTFAAGHSWLSLNWWTNYWDILKFLIFNSLILLHPQKNVNITNTNWPPVVSGTVSPESGPPSMSPRGKIQV